jgi:hypothetical protein
MTDRSLLVGLAVMVGLSFPIVTSAADPTKSQERFEQQMGKEGNQMGVPEPGTVQDQESTKKKRNPDKKDVPESTLSTAGGITPYFVEGEVLKIDGENYTIQDPKSGEIRLIVNQNTNLDCAKAQGDAAKHADTMTSDRVPSEKQAPQASERQREQGQRQDETARGAGFKIGDCSFHKGDRVKAEVDDRGHVTTLKYLAGHDATK